MQYDAIIVGGSYAGLSAAMQLARGLRRVCIVDAGKPRNRFAAASHGFFGRDGAAPYEMIAEAREKVLAYETVTFISGEVLRAQRAERGFDVELANGDRLEGKKLVLAYGISDQLPAIDGLRERWGKTVLHCPYCHGYEFRGQRLGVLAVMPMSPHQARLLTDWGPTTFFLHDQPEPDAETLQHLRAREVTIERARVVAVEGAATVRLDDGRAHELAALYLGARIQLNSTLHAQLGCAMDLGPLGEVIRANPDTRETTVPGVFAAGDISRFFANATLASADGVMAGAGVHHALIFGQ